MTLMPSFPSSFQNKPTGTEKCEHPDCRQGRSASRAHRPLHLGLQGPPPQPHPGWDLTSFTVASTPANPAQESRKAQPALYSRAFHGPRDCRPHLPLVPARHGRHCPTKGGWAEPTSQTPDSVLSFNEEPGEWSPHSPAGPPAADTPHSRQPRWQGGPEAASPAEG